MLEISETFVVGLVILNVVMGIAIIVLVIMLRKTKEQAHTDKVTGLWNRHFVEMSLPQELARAERRGLELIVISLDLDGFKAVNDKDGHFAGDACLRSVADGIAGALRKEDLLVRYGGDEFLAVISAEVGMAGEIAEKVRAAVDDLTGISSHVTASIGVACYPQIREADSLIQAADIAMYKAKNAGGNRVVMWGEEHS